MQVSQLVSVVLRSEIPSGMCASHRGSKQQWRSCLQSLFAYVGHHVRSFTCYRQSFHVAISLTIACSRYVHNGVILHAHPVRGESHN